MSGIAEVLLASGFEVTGSDLHSSPITERLSQLGAKIFYGHKAEHIKDCSCVVVSSAVPANNPEWQEARKQSIPVIPRAEMLAELMRLKKGVAVAGSHGKTTTTSMIGQLLSSLRPTVVVGGRVQHWNASSLVGKGSTFVIEADESDRSFLKFSPVYSVVTNIDREHLDNYRDIQDIQACFLEFLNRTAFFGLNWINFDCPYLREIRPQILKPTKTYGFSENANLNIEDIEFINRKSYFRLIYEGNDLGRFELPVVGRHNVSNAAAAVGIALSLGLSVGGIRKNLKAFVPADRRMQIHFESSNWAVLEDYAHHPTEIDAALQSFRLLFPNRKKFVLFQPHRFSRTEFLWNEFVEVLKTAGDALWLLPIYAAHESSREGVNSQALAEALSDVLDVQYLEKLPEPAQFASDLYSKAQDSPAAVLILGAAPSLTAYARDLSSSFDELAGIAQRLH